MSDEEMPVVHITEEDIIQQPEPKKPGPKPPKTVPLSAISKVGYEKPPPSDPVVTNRREFEEVIADGRKHQEALAKSTHVTTAAQDYISIIFTPAQIHFMKALLLSQKAPIADEILVKFDSAL
jgi:hypothetical protein